MTAHDPAVIGGGSSRHLPGRVVAPLDEPHVRGGCVGGGFLGVQLACHTTAKMPMVLLVATAVSSARQQ